MTKNIALYILLIAGLLLVAACNAREDRPTRKIQPTETTIALAPTNPPVTNTRPAPTATQIAPTVILPTAPRAAPTATPTPNRLTFKKGRNDYTISVDNAPRKYIVYVPTKYDPARPTPVVVMYHGSNQSGNLMYENTNWVDKAEKENIIVIFPTGWEYPLIGEKGLHEKWNAAGLQNETPPGTELKDDVRFSRALLDTITATFNVDSKRIFATGFSNGGSFVRTRLLPNMSDVFAPGFAICGSGVVGDIDFEKVTQAKGILNASLFIVLGTNDDKVHENTGHPLPLPHRADDIYKDSLFNKMFVTTTTLLALSVDYKTETRGPVTLLTFNKSSAGANNEFIFAMVNNMGHVYPSGNNNRYGLEVTDQFWDFFMRHPKP